LPLLAALILARRIATARRRRARLTNHRVLMMRAVLRSHRVQR
jgi:hypothetical protein